MTFDINLGGLKVFRKKFNFKLIVFILYKPLLNKTKLYNPKQKCLLSFCLYQTVKSVGEKIGFGYQYFDYTKFRPVKK